MLNDIFGIMNRFETDPVLMSPEYTRRFTSDLKALESFAKEPANQKFMQQNLVDPNFWPSDDDTSERAQWIRLVRPYVVKDGILEIPVKGLLLSRFPYSMFGWATGYTYIEKTLERGMEDGNVRGIVFVIDSGGGEVRGLFDLTDRIKTFKGVKPLKAVSADAAYSAAYAIASTADEITVTRTGGTGSVGVVTMHVDVSKAMDQEGYKVTFIHSGKHKVDGNSYEPLPDDVKARIQKRIDKTYSLFVTTVAENRNLSTEAVRATEALTYDAEDSLSIGFADKIGKLEDSLAEFSASLKTNIGEDEMSETLEDKKAVNQAAVTAAIEAAKVEAYAEGVKAERARVSGIMGSEEAKGRTESAVKMATTTDLTVEQATSLLADLPKASETATNAFDKAMEKGNPELNASTNEKDDATDPVDEIFSNYSAQTGITAKTAK